VKKRDTTCAQERENERQKLDKQAPEKACKTETESACVCVFVSLSRATFIVHSYAQNPNQIQTWTPLCV